MTSIKPSPGCMTILVGRKASSTGEVLVGHNEDAPGRFTMQTHLVHKKRRHSGTMAKFEPDLAEIELGQTRTNLFWAEAKTFSDDYSDSAFCDLYVNGNGVVICTNNCACSREDKPELLNGGIGYGLRRLVAERAHTAKEALEIACKLVEKYGYASSGRSYSFSDKDDIYVMQIVNGKHYAIQRVPDDEVAVIPNHYTIHDPDKRARGYSELISYAKRRGWYKPEEETFDFSRVYQARESYGHNKNTYRHVKAFEILLNMDLSGLLRTEWQTLPFSIKPAEKVNVDTLKKILRAHNEDSFSHFDKPISICNIDTLESTIIRIRHNPDRILIYKALGRPCCSPYIPWYFGINIIPGCYEYMNAEKALVEHFKTKPEDMDYRDNAWYRAMEIQAACEILGREKSALVHEKIRTFEEELESQLNPLDSQIELRLRNEPDIARAMMESILIMGAEKVEEFVKATRKALNIFYGEALTSVSRGNKFSVKLSAAPINFDDIDISQTTCGPSYAVQDKRSNGTEIRVYENYCELDFTPGEWFNDAVPCFTDLYISLADKSGEKYAGCVRIQVQR